MNSKVLIKRGIKNIVLFLALPLFCLYWIMSRGGNNDGVFQSYSQFLSLFPGKTGVYIRAAFYRLATPGTSDEISIGFLTVFSHRDTTILRGVYIGPQSNIGKCTIGKNTLLGSGVHVLSGSQQHNFSNPDRPIQEQGGHFEKIHIGADCWIGNSAVVMTDVPDNAIVAAASVLTKTPNAGDIVAGNPAKVIRNRTTVCPLPDQGATKHVQ
jgi:virginiamycin A acetyltransferase